MELKDVKTAEEPTNSPAKSPLADDLKLLEMKKGTRKQVKSGKSAPRSKTRNSDKDEKSNSVDPVQATAEMSKTKDVETAQAELRTYGVETASLRAPVDSRSSTEEREKLGMGTTIVSNGLNTESYGSAKTSVCQTAALAACAPQATTDGQRTRSIEKKHFKKSPIRTLFKKPRIRRQKTEEKLVIGSNQETVAKVDSRPDGNVDRQETLQAEISHKPRRRSKSSDWRPTASESAGRVQISKGLTLLIPLFIRSLQTVRVQPKVNEIVITTNVVLHSNRLSPQERKKELRNLMKVKAAVVNSKTMNDDGFREEQTAQNVLIGKHMIVVERKTTLLRSEQDRVLRTNDTRKYTHICEAKMGPTLETDRKSVSGILTIIAENGTSVEHEVYHKTERIIFNVSGSKCPPSADDTLPIRCEKSISHRDSVRFEERIFADKDRLIIDRDTVVDARNGLLWKSPRVFYAEERRSYDYQHTLPDGSLVWTNAVAPLREDTTPSEKSEKDGSTANELDSKFLRQTAELVPSVPSLPKQKPAGEKQEFPITIKQSEPTTGEKQARTCPKELDPKVAKNEVPSTAKEESQTTANEIQPPIAVEKAPLTAKKPLRETSREEPPVAAKETDLTTAYEEAQGASKAPLQETTREKPHATAKETDSSTASKQAAGTVKESLAEREKEEPLTIARKTETTTPWEETQTARELLRETAREEPPTTAKETDPSTARVESAGTATEYLTEEAKEEPPTIEREMETTTQWEEIQYAAREPLQETAREEPPATAQETGPITASEEAAATATESLIERAKEEPPSIASETEPTCAHEGTLCAPEESLRKTANEEHPDTDEVEKQASSEEPANSTSSLSQPESVASTYTKPEDQAQRQNGNENEQPQLVVSTEAPLQSTLQNAEQRYHFAVPMVVLAAINGMTYKLTTHYNITTDRSQLIFNPLSIKFNGRLLWEMTESAEVSETLDPVASYTIPQEVTRDLSVIGAYNSS